MPAFFIPGTNTPEEATELWIAIVRFARENGYQPTERRIFSLAYRRGERDHFAEVGKMEPQFPGEGIVYAILDASLFYLICKRDRGVERGIPVLVGKHDAFRANDFD